MGQETGSCLGSFDTGVNYLQLIAAHLIDGHRINAVIHLMDFQFIIRHWRNKKSTKSLTEVQQMSQIDILHFKQFHNIQVIHIVDDLVSAQV